MPGLRRRTTQQFADLTDVSPSEELPPEENGSLLMRDDDEPNGDEDTRSISTMESFTLKDRQTAINATHPFGIRIWKPALYKKLRSIERSTEGDIHSSPGQRSHNGVFLVNIVWTLFFGWVLALASVVGAVACFAVSASDYARVFLGLAGYLFYPFGSFVLLESDENYAEEDQGEGRSMTEYERWQNGDIEDGRLFFGPVDDSSSGIREPEPSDDVLSSEHDALLGSPRHSDHEEGMAARKRRLFGRGQWTVGRVIFYAIFYLLVGPLLLLATWFCYLSVFWIPMGRISSILFRHLRRHPLALSFHDPSLTRSATGGSSSILLCTYRAAGFKYWKYTIDGTNIFFINLIAVVLFTIFDYFVLYSTLQLDSWIAHPALLFTLGLLSILPLAFFIGQAVASISAQSSMGMGAAVNAFFSTVVEVYLYCVALTEGKAKLVEGSIIGSIFAGVLFLPGLSMCFGALVRKTQKFNARSAGVTSTMLLFAIIAALGPTLFYQVYGSHELNCYSCASSEVNANNDCRRCYFTQAPAPTDDFFLKAVQPYTVVAAVLLFLSYCIGLWFTLRTHAALIWYEEKKGQVAQVAQQTSNPRILRHAPSSPYNQGLGQLRDSPNFTRTWNQSLRQPRCTPDNPDAINDPSHETSSTVPNTPLPPTNANLDNKGTKLVPSLSKEENESLVRKVTEVAVNAATTAARDVSFMARSRKNSVANLRPHMQRSSTLPLSATLEEGVSPVPGVATFPPEAQEADGAHGGHDAPNWGRMKSSIILLSATILYAIVAEILVKTVDVVLQSVDVEEKFLGITLFALVPNTTEFLNAISFAMNGNIALSMEIGSAYALQVCLLQIPALVVFSAVYASYLDPSALIDHTFNMIFPQWDMITIVLCVFLLSYMYGEGKSNYFKGSILLMSYIFVVVGFHLSSYSSLDANRVNHFDTLAVQTEDIPNPFHVRELR